MKVKPEVIAFCALALILAGCGEEDIGQSPVTQLRGQWLMVERAENCDHSFVQFATSAIYRVYDKGQPKKYFDIKKYTVAPGKVTLAVDAADPNADMGQSLVFVVDGDTLHLTDILRDTGESYKTPAADTDPDIQKHMTTVYRLTAAHFNLARCPTE
jgi:hypothetical protein